MLNLLLSLPEANLLTFLFLLDHLKRYPSPASGSAFCARGLPSDSLAPGVSPALGTRATAAFFPLTTAPSAPGLNVRCFARPAWLSG